MREPQRKKAAPWFKYRECFFVFFLELAHTNSSFFFPSSCRKFIFCASYFLFEEPFFACNFFSRRGKAKKILLVIILLLIESFLFFSSSSQSEHLCFFSFFFFLIFFFSLSQNSASITMNKVDERPKSLTQ